MTDLESVRLVVTAPDQDGRGVIVTDSQVPAQTVQAYPGCAFHLLWGTEDGGPHSDTAVKARPVVSPYFAGPAGTRFLVARYLPEAEIDPPVGDARELEAEVKATFPGLWEAFPDPASGVHSSATIDYAVCLAGEMVLELSGGEEVLLTPGTCVVQVGAGHAWHNRGAVEAVMSFVGVGFAEE